jgi:hypothetical protein
MGWYYNPHTGGRPIPPEVQSRTRARIAAHAAKRHAGRYDRLEVRFRGALCYVDAHENGESQPTHLIRMRYLGDPDRWSLAFYTYSHERYEPCLFADGSERGTPEAAFDVGAVYLA